MTAAEGSLRYRSLSGAWRSRSSSRFMSRTLRGKGAGRCVAYGPGSRTNSTEENPVSNPTTMPSIGHVAVTVADLEVSERWYTRVFGVAPVLDEDTGPF